MSDNRWPPDPTLFAETATYYAQYRLGYSTKVFDYLVNAFRLDDCAVALDLGCGTGQIALPLAMRGVLVHAVDPDIEMLREGIRAESHSGPRGIRWQVGNDAMIDQLHLPQLAVCVMGASFHWMDREKTLIALDRLILPSGGVAILSGSCSALGQGSSTAWEAIVKETIRDFLGDTRRAGKGTYDHPNERHEAVLSQSAFSEVTLTTFEDVVELNADHIVGLQLSSSYASPFLLGTHKDAFVTSLQDRLHTLSPSGRFVTRIVTEVIEGHRHQ